ncbi:HVO_0476 family zinc finger protein [Halospeciosus flavus]|uniref:HVO_0476 family zinc finger protein n=1 Tax=Halospeciosus flavus TaxID=3032283 RepID=A0ABD5Z6A8_9EURY|nr:HVO_0476 family zinc finger protein [Halospeciosus flavus]
MTEQTERVAVACPSCSPSLETVHEVLTTGGGNATVKCTECGHVHKESMDEEKEVEREVVVSQDGESFKTRVSAPPDEEVAVGEEFLVETDEAIMQVRITGIEVGPEQRREETTIEEVDTFWTRVVDNVSVDVTVHPNGGKRDESRSVTIQVPGDYRLEVGEVEEFADEEFEIDAVVVRDDAERYNRKRYEHEGDWVEAKDAKRVYAFDQKSEPWSAW